MPDARAHTTSPREGLERKGRCSVAIKSARKRFSPTNADPLWGFRYLVDLNNDEGAQEEYKAGHTVPTVRAHRLVMPGTNATWTLRILRLGGKHASRVGVVSPGFEPKQDWYDDKLVNAAWYLTPVGCFSGSALCDDRKLRLREQDELALHLSWSPDGTGTLRFTLNGKHMPGMICGIRGGVHMACQLLNRRDAIAFVGENVESDSAELHLRETRGTLDMWSHSGSRPADLHDWGAASCAEDHDLSNAHGLCGVGARVISCEGAPRPDQNSTKRGHQSGVKNEERLSLHKHRGRLLALQAKVEQLDDALSGEHSPDEVKKDSQKLRNELAVVYAEYVHDHSLHEPATTDASKELGLEHAYEDGEPALKHEDNLRDTSSCGQPHKQLQYEEHTNASSQVDSPASPPQSVADAVETQREMTTLMEVVSRLQTELRFVVSERDSLRTSLQRQRVQDIDRSRTLQRHELSIQQLQSCLEQRARQHGALTQEYQLDISHRAVMHEALVQELEKARAQLNERTRLVADLEQQVDNLSARIQDPDFGGQTWQPASASSSASSAGTPRRKKLLATTTRSPQSFGRRMPPPELYNMRPRSEVRVCRPHSASYLTPKTWASLGPGVLPQDAQAGCRNVSASCVTAPGRAMVQSARLEDSSGRRNREALLTAAASDDAQAVAGILALVYNDERRRELAAQTLRTAAKRGSEAVCVQLLAGHAEGFSKEDLESALFSCAEGGQRAIFDVLVKEESVDPLEALDADRASPLIVAAFHGHVEIVQVCCARFYMLTRIHNTK